MRGVHRVVIRLHSICGLRPVVHSHFVIPSVPAGVLLNRTIFHAPDCKAVCVCCVCGCRCCLRNLSPVRINRYCCSVINKHKMDEGLIEIVHFYIGETLASSGIDLRYRIKSAGTEIADIAVPHFVCRCFSAGEQLGMLAAIVCRPPTAYSEYGWVGNCRRVVGNKERILVVRRFAVDAALSDNSRCRIHCRGRGAGGVVRASLRLGVKAVSCLVRLFRRATHIAHVPYTGEARPHLVGSRLL